MLPIRNHLIYWTLLPVIAWSMISSSHSETILIDHTFDGVSNDIGPAFQEVTNGLGAGGSSNLSTGVITTGDSVVGVVANSTYAINTDSSVDLTAAVPSASGFSVTYFVRSTDVSVNSLAANGLFLGVVSGKDANGQSGSSLFNNNPHAFGYIAGSGNSYGYGDNVIRQDAEGGQDNGVMGTGNDANSVNTALDSKPPTNASYQDGFTLTLRLFNDNTWTITSTGLSAEINGSGNLTTSGTGMFDYASIAADINPQVSLQGEKNGSITIDRILVTAIFLIDTDNDGMTDAWEDSNKLNKHDPKDAQKDNDGDGADNLSESIAGTDPNNSSSVLRVEKLADDPSTVSVTWPSTAGRSYELFWSTDNATWQSYSLHTGTGKNLIATLDKSVMDNVDGVPGNLTEIFVRVHVRK